MERELELRLFCAGGSCPFSEWLATLRDSRAVAAVRARLNRVRLGNFGDCRPVGSGVAELRIDYGPGYRVYYGREGSTVVLLLCGGRKRTQARDILTAKAYWKEYRNAKEDRED